MARRLRPRRPPYPILLQRMSLLTAHHDKQRCGRLTVAFGGKAEVERQGKPANSGLDVFDKEPLPPGHPLTKMPNVVLTSHLGWPTDEMYSQFADAAADILLAYADGKEVPRFGAAH